MTDRAETEALLEEETAGLGLHEGEDESEVVRLTFKQKIITGVAVLVAFIVFSFVFLPYELVIRYTLEKYSRFVRIEFTSLKLNLIGDDEISGFRMVLPDGTAFAADSVTSGLKYRDLLAGGAQGSVLMTGVGFSMGNVVFRIGTIDLGLGIQNATSALDQLSGDINLRAGKVEVRKLPENLPIAVQPGDIKISSVVIRMKIGEGRVNLEGTNLKSNLFDIRVTGGARLSGPIGQAVMAAKVCLKPAKDLETENNAMFGYYTMSGGTGGGELCLGMKGTLSQPTFEKEKE
ncbi:MAG: type II secretion system protein GspN [Spirochaetia bacterium]|nr:type II secretion system protein GspN [Spirochaetia bacterium]